jgi:hypothetical protein
MATIRMARSAGAALILLTAIVPAASVAQAPLQLVPGPEQARRIGGVTKPAAKPAVSKPAARKTAQPGKSGNQTRTAASKNPARQNATTAQATSRKTSTRPIAVAAKPASKSARIKPTRAATSVASRHQNESTANAPRARVANASRAEPAVTQSATAEPTGAVIGLAPMPALLEPPIFAQGGNEHVSSDNVMRGSDSVSLVGKLPWWRSHPMQDVTYGSEEAESQVMAAADAWFAAHGGRAAADDDVPDASGAPDDTVEIADAGEVNEIDLAAPPPSEPGFLQSLLALISGAVAAARLLFT